MTVVIDTNVLIPMLSLRRRFGMIIEAWMDGRFALAISNEVATEYEELITARLGRTRWLEFWALLEVVGELHGNVRRVAPTFRFRLITADADDDKFADCAIVADADCVVTEDGHFDVLAGAGYKVRAITPEEFIRRHLTEA